MAPVKIAMLLHLAFFLPMVFAWHSGKNRETDSQISSMVASSADGAVDNDAGGCTSQQGEEEVAPQKAQSLIETQLVSKNKPLDLKWLKDNCNASVDDPPSVWASGTEMGSCNVFEDFERCGFKRYKFEQLNLKLYWHQKNNRTVEGFLGGGHIVNIQDHCVQFTIEDGAINYFGAYSKSHFGFTEGQQTQCWTKLDDHGKGLVKDILQKLPLVRDKESCLPLEKWFHKQGNTKCFQTNLTYWEVEDGGETGSCNVKGLFKRCGYAHDGPSLNLWYHIDKKSPNKVEGVLGASLWEEFGVHCVQFTVENYEITNFEKFNGTKLNNSFAGVKQEKRAVGRCTALLNFEMAKKILFNLPLIDASNNTCPAFMGPIGSRQHGPGIR